jgi:hypothetical protein
MAVLKWSRLPVTAGSLGWPGCGVEACFGGSPGGRRPPAVLHRWRSHGDRAQLSLPATGEFAPSVTNRNPISRGPGVGRIYNPPKVRYPCLWRSRKTSHRRRPSRLTTEPPSHCHGQSHRGLATVIKRRVRVPPSAPTLGQPWSSDP